MRHKRIEKKNSTEEFEAVNLFFSFNWFDDQLGHKIE